MLLPGSGKTTRARQLEKDQRALRLTPDEWMIPLFGEAEADGKRDVLEGRLVWLAIRALRLGVTVVLDFGVWAKEERSALRSLAAQAGAECQLIYLPIDHAEQRERIEARFAADPGSTFDMQPKDLHRARQLFQAPSDDEHTGQIDQPPPGYPTWVHWASKRWPTSTA